jgi:hypothetical protein
VSACDLVIRYTGVNSLIQFIQSRGRARREGSRFLILVTPDEHEEAKKLESQERIMDHVLSEHAATVELPGPLTRRLMAQEGDEGNFQSRRPGERAHDMAMFDAAPEGTVVVDFYLEDSQNLDLEKVYDYIQGVIF